MKASTIFVILALQAILLLGLSSAVVTAEHNGLGESKVDINPNPLKCCDNCVFTYSGLCHCDDVVKKCYKTCQKCAQVQASPRRFMCQDTFLGTCGPRCTKK